jgi:photosystem II stability/assembly factor-like uncharacterized protein
VAASAGLSNTNIFALAIDPTQPNVLYAGTDNGLFKSLDGAANWSAINAGLDEPASISALLIDPLVSSTLYAATEGRIFKSKDGGNTWTGIQTDSTDLVIYALAASRQYPGILYAGTNLGVFAIRSEGVR